MFCSKCGAQNPDGSAFCSSCGAKMRQQTAPTPQVAVPVPESAPVTAELAPTGAPVFSYGPDGAQTTPAPLQKQRRLGGGAKKGIIAAVVALAVIGGAGFGVYKAFFEPYPITTDTFPDTNFRAYVLTNLDTNHDGQLSRDEAKQVTTLGTYNYTDETYSNTLSNQEITSFQGIEYFTELTSLVATGNPVTDVDLTKNTKLETVNLRGESLKTLDVTGCDNLTSLWVSEGTVVTGVTSSLKENLMLTGYKVAYSGSSNSSTTTYSYTYGLDGRLTDSKVAGSSYTQKTHYTYDDNGNVSGSTYKYDGSSSSSEKTTTYEFNAQGLKTKQVLEDGSYTYTTDYTYDDAGYIATANNSGQKGSSTTYTTSWAFTFANGAPTASTYTSSSYNNSTKTTELTYNADGTVAAATLKWSTGSSTAYEYSYDEKGRVVSSTATYTSADGSVGSPYTTTYTWNEDGKKMTKTYNGNTDSSTVYTYDDNGNMIECELLYKGNTSMKWTVSYEKGSLVSKYTIEMYNTSKNTVSSTNTYTATYAKLYSATDYESRVNDYQIKYPYESYFQDVSTEISLFFGRYEGSMTKTGDPRQMSDMFFSIA